MGERERGKPDPPATAQPIPVAQSASLFSPPLSRSASATHQLRDRRLATQALAATTSNGNDIVNNLASTNKPTTTPQGWTAPLRQVLWEKWRWGVLIAFAVIVSRLSSSP
jgi:ubiquitin-conjugating enzyme E2 J2